MTPMKTFISRLMLLATGILCLSCKTPVHSRTIDKEKIETLQMALKTASEKSKPVTIEAAYNEAGDLIQFLTKEVETDTDYNLRFKYADKWFILKDDGAGKESSHIVYENAKTKIVLFVPEIKKK